MVAPSFIRLASADDRDSRLIDQMLGRLAAVHGPNEEARKRYEGEWAAEQFGISIPPNMRGLESPTGWDGTVVDILEERLDWLGWTSSEADEFGLDEVYSQNALDVDGGMAHLDALIFGLSFVSVGSGFAGEPHPLITPHSPQSMTALWDRRTRRLSSALAVATDEDGQPSEVTLYRPDETVTYRLSGGMWRADERDEHGLGRLPVALIPNRVRGSRELGRSEITKAIRYYSDAASRTLTGLEVNREFYNAPQRIGLNVDDSMFEDAAGNPVSPWTSIMGRVWNIPAPEDADAPAPDVKQFNPASPAPYIDQIQGYAMRVSSEAGIPATYFGVNTDNPASADAIRAAESRLVKRAERRQAAFGRSWLEVARLALLVRDGVVPPEFAEVSTKWRDAATPTRAASADEALKLTSGDNPILPPDSSVTYDRIGLSEAEQRQVTADKRRASGRMLAETLRQATRGSTAEADADDVAG